MTLPFYPFYWGDYSSKTFNLTNVQHGIYLLLLRNFYTDGEPLATVEQCYSIAKALPEQHADVDFILHRFFTKENGFWVNKKAENVKKEWENKHQRRVIAGQKAKKKCLSNDQAMSKQPEPEPEPIERRKKEPTVLSKEKRGSRIPDNFEPDASCHMLAEKLLLTNRECQDALENFIDYWRGVPAAKGVKLDWQATFRNQLRHISKQKGKPNGNYKPSHKQNSIDRAGEELIADIRARAASGRLDTDGDDVIESLPGF
jgi:uncharacterized protein YdaU (DUF1376 family)